MKFFKRLINNFTNFLRYRVLKQKVIKINVVHTRELYSLEKVENENMVTDPSFGDKPVVFGFLNYRWIDIKSKLENEDKIYKYTRVTKISDSNNGCMEEGFEIMRNNEIIFELRTSYY